MNYELQMVFREQALALPGIGKALADKIMEMVEDGRIRKVDEVFVIIIIFYQESGGGLQQRESESALHFLRCVGRWTQDCTGLVGQVGQFLGGHCLQTPFSFKHLLRGFRSLDDLKGANLTRQQEVFKLL